MKAIKVDLNYLDELISTDKSTTDEKNKGMNLKKVIILHDYLSLII